MDGNIKTIIDDLNCAKILSDLANNQDEYLNMIAFLGIDRAIEMVMKVWVETREGRKLQNINFKTLIEKAQLDADNGLGEKLNDHHNEYRNYNKHDTKSLLKAPRGQFVQSYYELVLEALDFLYQINQKTVKELYDVLKGRLRKIFGISGDETPTLADKNLQFEKIIAERNLVKEDNTVILHNIQKIIDNMEFDIFRDVLEDNLVLVRNFTQGISTNELITILTTLVSKISSYRLKWEAESYNLNGKIERNKYDYPRDVNLWRKQYSDLAKVLSSLKHLQILIFKESFEEAEIIEKSFRENCSYHDLEFLTLELVELK